MAKKSKATAQVKPVFPSLRRWKIDEYPKAGEFWKVRDVRKGALTVRLQEDVDPTADDFFEAEIVSGQAQYISTGYNLAQRYDGLGLPGSVISLRTTLCQFLEQVEAPPDYKGPKYVDPVREAFDEGLEQ